MTDNHNSLIISYLGLRRIIGIIGICHPIVLYFGGVWVFSTGLQTSMSSYYYTGMRDVFVGLIFVSGFFLLCYHGYDKHDRIVSLIAGFCALLVALFPTSPPQNPTHFEKIIGGIHIGSAFIFLSALAWFCLILFTRGSPEADVSRNKKRRNLIYRCCGVTIIISLLATSGFFMSAWLQQKIGPYQPIFAAETVAFIAFGIAWLIKGQTLFTD